MTHADLIARAKAWVSSDPDPLTRAELLALVAHPNLDETDLADRFAGSLEFGTAGLRGVIGAGPNRMNRAVVLRTTWGLAEFLLSSAGGGDAADVRSRGVVIGFDGRRMSREFAEDAACVLAARGIRAHLFADVAPTPLTAFAVTRLGCAAGVMVTASHNPPEYNGYKTYWKNGAQIIPPIDSGIARAIERAPAANAVPRLAIDEARAQGKVAHVPEAVERAYLDGVRALGVSSGGDRALEIVYTPLHGVGNRLARKAFDEAGFPHVTTVPEQAEPDGAFPTVTFPNPEEKGAMDLSFALAKKKNAALVLANDPDADRLAVAVPSGGGDYVQLTGNQVGVLLGHYVLTQGKKTDNRLVIASIVSSPMLGVIAEALGVRYEEVLTGFKWIANRAMDLAREKGQRFVFGYEEALGYTVGELVRDKDGISAAVIFAELTAVLRASGKTVQGELEGLYRTYGLYVSSQVSVTKKGADGAAQIKALMSALRASPPKAIGAHEVLAVRDYQTQTRTANDGTKTALALPPSNVLTFELKGGSRVIARPSGTEPKVKFYFDVREPIARGEPLAAAEARARRAMSELAAAFTKLAASP